MKFGKHIQKRQLEIPEYAASFVDYKALKKLIKKLSATPVIPAQDEHSSSPALLDPRAALQANKGTFFFHLERELEKVNTFYLQKEAELRMRMTTLVDKKRDMQSHGSNVSKTSSQYIALEEGFRQFGSDLDKLQQFIEINATAFSKILKKWDKTSKEKTKEIYLSCAVEIQPCFNRDVIREMTDQCTSNLQDFADWAEGERMNRMEEDTTDRSPDQHGPNVDELDIESQILEAINAGNLAIVQEWIGRVGTLPDGRERITRAFLNSANDAPDASLNVMWESHLVDARQPDDINRRNILHKAAISGRDELLQLGLSGGADVTAADVYGRTPLHYASMHGFTTIIDALVKVAPRTINVKDVDNFSPLIHAIVNSQLECVGKLLEYGAQVDPAAESNDHIPLNLACQHSPREIVELLLKKKPLILPDAEGLYPQHLLARTAHDADLLLLLDDYGADLDQPDKLYGWTPLFHAASEGNVVCLRALLESGVNPRILDEKSLSSMYYATWEGHIECMRLLAERGVARVSISSTTPRSVPPSANIIPSSATPIPMQGDVSNIPEITLPPPILPVRRYGHNFLDNKTFIAINFGDLGYEPIQFYKNTKYPASRLTVSSKSSDLIPRNLLLPIQDESKVISFQIDNIDTFSIDFDIYPTFGSRIIGRAVASSRVFTQHRDSSGVCDLELFDPRLRVIGHMSFKFKVVKPFPGTPLEITHFATYWRATSRLESESSTLITGSSLSGEYARLFVQLTSDGVPILYPQWRVDHEGLSVSVNSLTLADFDRIGARHRHSEGTDDALAGLENATSEDIPRVHQVLARAFTTLQQALATLPPQVNVELHVLYPNPLEEERLRLGKTVNVNDFVDALLTVVFEHARKLRDMAGGHVRSMVFSSFNQDICTALNWKQPNYPVLLCNELGADVEIPAAESARVYSSGRTTISVKEAVQIAKDNNFMGLICSSRLLEMAPSLVSTIKAASLVLITDQSDVRQDQLQQQQQSGPPVATPSFHGLPNGVDGFLKSSGVLRFHDSIDM